MPKSTWSVRPAVVWAGIFLSVVGACSCQPSPKWNLAPVEGTVTRNGRPLARVEVIFWPDGGGKAPRASGFTNEAGRYELRMDSGERGAPPGKFRVCLVAPRSAETVQQAADRLAKSSLPKERQEKRLKMIRKRLDAAPPTGAAVHLPPEYSTFDKTPLRVEVQANGDRTFDFEVP